MICFSALADAFYYTNRHPKKYYQSAHPISYLAGALVEISVLLTTDECRKMATFKEQQVVYAATGCYVI